MNKKEKRLTLIIGCTGALAVILGAFGAHYLKAHLSNHHLTSYQTGIAYHFYHLLAMLGCYSLYVLLKNKRLLISFYLFFVGILLFSGSIYLLSTQTLTGLSIKWLGPITPIGGVLFILGWLNFLTLNFNKNGKN